MVGSIGRMVESLAGSMFGITMGNKVVRMVGIMVGSLAGSMLGSIHVSGTSLLQWCWICFMRMHLEDIESERQRRLQPLQRLWQRPR